jgi:4-amino-4-deoxy-L-arabinose transferase-like glycosyltransferase
MISDPKTNTFQKWSSRDWTVCALLVLISGILFCAGLSIRSLWGSEGRWAVIAREMVQSGNLFLPTINGEVYFDKPLLSYWAIIPFYLAFGMTEAAARLPSAIAAIALVVLVFAMGRDLFGERTGIISAALFLTSVMFVFWSRTASAEMLNLLAIWSMLWVFLRGARGGHLLHLLIFFCIGAAASFCKGPVAFVVAFAVVVMYSAVNVLFLFRGQALSWHFAKEQVLNKYKWILSWQGFAAAAAGALLFVMLLLLPVFFTGSWDSVLLMWKENVIRFVKPFDHVEPPYAYLVHSLVFSSPWTFVVLVSLWDIVRCENDWKRRWLIVVTVTIFLFFTVSGSRRSYYILPIVPALVLVAGKSLSYWFEGEENIRRTIIKLAVIVTAVIPLLVGAAMIYAYLKLEDFKHISEIVLGPLALAGGTTALWFVLKNRAKRGFIFLFLLFFVLELWGFTIGVGMAEKKRTLKPFCLKANEMLKGVDDDIIALYGVTNSSLIYYLKRDRALHNLKDLHEFDTFSEEHREFFLIAEATLVPSIQSIYAEGEALAVLEQEPEGKRDRENSFVLMKIVKQSERDTDEDEDNEGEE